MAALSAERAPHLVEGSVVTEILNILTRGLTSYVAGPDGASSTAALLLREGKQDLTTPR